MAFVLGSYKRNVRKACLLFIAAQVFLLLFSVPGYAKDLSYARLVQERIAQCVQTANARGLQGQVRLNLGLLPNGELEEVRIGQSSGNRLLDQEAIKSVQRAAPYPPFPKDLRKTLLWIEVPIIYRGEVNTRKTASRKQRTNNARVVANNPTPGVAPHNPETIIPLHNPDSLDLDECMEVALANSLSAQIAQEQIRLASLKVREARRDLFPSLAGEWKSTDGETITDPFESKSYGLEAEQTVYDGGKAQLSFSREGLGLEIARRNYEKVKGDLSLQVLRAYYELAKSQMLVKNQEDLLKDVKPYLELSSRQYNAGLSTEAEFLEVQSLWEQASYQESSFQSDFALARLALHQALNLDPEEAVKIKPQLIVPDKGSNETDLPHSVMLNDCLNQALEIRPEVAITEMGVDSAKYGQRIAKRENWPKLSMVTSYGESGEAYATEDLVTAEQWSVIGKVSWMFGGSSLEYARTKDKVTALDIVDVSRKTEATTDSFKFSLLDNLGYFTGEKEADIIYQQSIRELNDIKERIRSEVEEAYLNYQKAIKALTLARERIGFRQKAFTVLKAKMNAGEASISDLFKARIKLADEVSFHTQSLSNYHLAKATLAWATGQGL